MCKKIIPTSCAAFRWPLFAVVGFHLLGLAARAAGNPTVFSIGVPDGDYHDLAIAGKYAAYARQFADDVHYVVGQSDPRRDWPYIQPGPADNWAGNRTHPFQIHFQLAQPETNYCRLVIDFIGAHPTDPPLLDIAVNGRVFLRKVHAGGNEQVLTNPRYGAGDTLQQIIGPGMLHAGDNTITLTATEGSWAVYDDVRLESNVPAPAEPVTLQAEPLPFFKQTPDGLRRALKVSVEDLEGSATTAELTWRTKTLSGSQKFDLSLGDAGLTLLVPDVGELDLTLRTAGREIETPVLLPPAKKWTVYIVPTTHTDIGYTDFQNRVKVRHANNGLQALAWMDEYPDFRWYSETFWQLKALLDLHPEKTDEVFRRLREKRFGLSGDYANMLTGLCSSEALNRLTLDSQNLANRAGVELNSVILDDVPSAIGSVPMVYADSGIKYFIEGANHDRAPYSTQGLLSPFYWEGPDGSRVLSQIVRGYGQAGRLISSVAQATKQLPDFLSQYEVAAYPYDAVLVNGSYSDNREIQPWLPKVVAAWNAQWDYPKLVFAMPEDYFGYLERNFSNSLPVLKTDFGGWWEDGAGSTALETTLSRRAEERATTAEMLHSLAAITTGASYPKTNFDDVWHNILLYNEHTWGASRSISEPQSEETVKQWAVKAAYAHKADAETRDLLKSGMAELAAMAPPSDLVVFNQLAWSRSALVRTDLGGAVQDAETKQVLPCQALPEGGNCFIADHLPGIGYRSYHTAALKDTPPPAVRISGNQMENEFYRVTLNPKTGGIQSIYDKELGRELVDTNSQYDLGELIYVTGGEGTYAIHSDLTNLPPPKFEYHWQSGTGIESLNGPVFGELDSEAAAENFPGIKLRVRLYRGLKQLDLVYELDKTETTNKEAVYLAFPFALDPRPGGLWLEYPDAVTEPLADQHGSACRDWYSVQRWLAVSDGDDTVEISPLDAPLFTLGHMTGSTWPRETSLKRGHVFAYLMNNYWHTNYKASQGGHFVFRYSLTSSAGGFSKHAAVVRGWNMYCPPAAALGRSDANPANAAARSLVGLEPAGLPLTTIKQAEDGNGFIFRYCDYAGEGGTAKLTLPAPARQVLDCNLVEMRGRDLNEQGSTITAPVKPFGPVTLKVSCMSRR